MPLRTPARLLALCAALPFAALTQEPPARPGDAWSDARNPVREVWKGARATLKAGFRHDMVVTVPKGEAGKLKAELLSLSPVVAPVAEGGRVGNLRVTLDGKPVGEFPVVALEEVPAAGLFGRAWDTLRLWLK